MAITYAAASTYCNVVCVVVIVYVFVCIVCDSNRTLFFAGPWRGNPTLVGVGESGVFVPWGCEGGGVSML